MGAKQSISIYQIYPSLSKWKSQFECLSMTDISIGFLYRIYGKMSPDMEKTITIENFLRFFGFHKCEFMRRAFSVLDKKRLGHVTFRQFVLIIWNYCTLGSNMALFAFDLYDFDGNEMLDKDEADALLKDIYGKYYAKSRKGQKLNAKIQELGKEGVARLFWREFAVKNPAVIQPCFEYQKKIMKKCLGARFWHERTEHRVVLTKGKYVSANELSRLVKYMVDSRENTGSVDGAGIEQNKSLDELIHTHRRRRSLRHSRSSFGSDSSARGSFDHADDIERSSHAKDSPKGAGTGPNGDGEKVISHESNTNEIESEDKAIADLTTGESLDGLLKTKAKPNKGKARRYSMDVLPGPSADPKSPPLMSSLIGSSRYSGLTQCFRFSNMTNPHVFCIMSKYCIRR